MNDQKIIDLRSDTVTKPSAGMREQIASAEVGDDVYEDDPTINSLENRVAKLFGKEMGLFCASGSLANQLSIKMLVAPGEELITETNSHIVRAELGAGAVFSGITTRTWLADRGLLSAADPINIARPDSGPFLVSTTAIAIENTHNFGGGTIQPLEEIKKLSQQSQALGIALHLDGARIWNAHIATGIELSEYGKYFDTISVCLSKGLGAPVGSLMLSTRERVIKARTWRKRYGGGMRQIGILAAAGHYALDHNLSLIKFDHIRAKKIAVAVAQVAPKIINPEHVETNIIGLDISSLKLTAAELSTQLKDNGILSSPLGPKYLRLVTHLDISDTDVQKINTVLPQLLQRALMS